MHATGRRARQRLTIIDVDRDRSAVARAGAVLRTGGLVALPTETVYGLGANAWDPVAVRRIFAAKGRPADNPLIVHLADASQLDRVAATVTPLARSLAARFWPGPLTIVVDAASPLPSVTTGGLSTVAVRVPDHVVARAVIAAAGVPVAAPSANRSGRPSPTTADHVAADLEDRLDLLIDGGPTGLGVESTVVDARGELPVVYREGALTREELGPVMHNDGPAAPSPGARYRHYAPACAVEIVQPDQLAARVDAVTTLGLRVGTVAPSEVRFDTAVPIARYSDVDELARDLYRALRDAEAAHVDVLLCTAVPETGVGRAVMDRLRRAAAG
ncbi:MAG TPA: L-threonylcarbamoyladenylate synthase [Euzebyales bacterium]|nr:L-threonylcarbamoyladenylate synthase [Euzebyales bacterium]